MNDRMMFNERIQVNSLLGAIVPPAESDEDEKEGCHSEYHTVVVAIFGAADTSEAGPRRDELNRKFTFMTGSLRYITTRY